ATSSRRLRFVSASPLRASEAKRRFPSRRRSSASRAEIIDASVRRSARGTLETRSVVRIASALVTSQLRIRAQGTRQFFVCLGRDHRRRRSTALNPVFNRGQRIEAIRTRAAAAVKYPRREEKTHTTLRRRHFLQNGLEVGDCRERARARIVE